MTSVVERTVRTGQAIAKGARRPQTLPTQAREVASTVVAAALYPLGWLDGGPGGRVTSHPAPGPSTTAPVLFVHGYLSNKSNWYFLERDLRAAGYGQIHAMNYSSRNADLVDLSAACVERAHEVLEATGASRLHLIGHSLGGLVIRDAVQRRGLDRAASVITVASPHGGVDLARLNRVLGRDHRIGRQLRPGSSYLRGLWGAARPTSTRFVAYYSNLDLLVPGRRAMILEQELAPSNILVKDHGHLSIVLSRQLASSVIAQLGQAEAARPAAA